MAQKGTGKPVRIELTAQLIHVDHGEATPHLAAYAFGSGGRLLGKTDLKEGGGTLSFEHGAEPVRVIVGPRLETEKEGQLLADLVRIGGAEKMLYPAALAEAAKLNIPIDRGVWHCWLVRPCVVRGTLLKRFVTGGVPVDLPVCNAEVEVWEAETWPLVVQHIPDSVIAKLREVIRVPIGPPPPEDGIIFPPQAGPVPRPGPGPDPGPLFGLAGTGAGVARGALAREIGVPGAQAPKITDKLEKPRLFQIAAEERGPSARETYAVLQAAAADPALTRAAAIGDSALRDALTLNEDLGRQIICCLFPRAILKQLVACAVTDDCGHFRAVFLRSCDADAPNLYFAAYEVVGSWRIPIYWPLPIACYTWWNYACGTEVTLVTTSAYANGCPPCRPIIVPQRDWVLAMGVGATSFASINGTSAMLVGSTNAGNIGLTDGAPFGGYLRLHFEFDFDLLNDFNVRYYQVSWRRSGTANPFVPITDAVFRHYTTKAGGIVTINPYLLGPQTVGATGNLFEMPPALPPAGQWTTSSDPRVDATSAGFASASFAPPAAAGLYDFKLDLYDATGVQVNATSLGIGFYVPNQTDLTQTITTTDASTLGLVTGGSLIFQLHIDNNFCTGSIDAPVLNGVAADDDCGLLKYDDTSETLTVGWTASHPNGFATYGFGVQRGIHGVLSTSGLASPPGTHTTSPTVAQLLQECTIAGFAELLNVFAMATDGYGRQSQYDAGAVRAFVLSPRSVT